MKQVINGANQDKTSAVLAWLQSGNRFDIAVLYMFGDFDDPNVLRLTDWESPLTYSLIGTFTPGVVERGSVMMKIGFEVQELDVTWHPKYSEPTQSLKTANSYQKARIGVYDDMPVRIWKAYMPTPGDCDTYGCSELFGGRVGDVEVDRGEILFNVRSFLDVVNKKIPMQVIELSNPIAATKAATPPIGLSEVPQFNIIAGSTNGALICQATSPTPDQIFDEGTLRNGFLVFNDDANATVGGRWSAIMYNQTINVSGTDYNLITLFDPLPWAPDPTYDTLYISGAAPLNEEDGDYLGFPFVPTAEQAI